MPRNPLTTGLLDHRRLVRDEEEGDAWLKVGSLFKAEPERGHLEVLGSLGPRRRACTRPSGQPYRQPENWFEHVCRL